MFAHLLAGRRVLWGFAVLIVLAGGAMWLPVVHASAAPDEPWPYEWPVHAPVIDGFRPPSTPYGAGNRGLEFSTASGTEVTSAGSGWVVFAGQVGGRLHVTTAHPDRLRISYSGLASVAVRRGQSVGRGDPIGTTGERFHVGTRVGVAYVDPAIVFGGRTLVYLVPTGRPVPELALPTEPL